MTQEIKIKDVVIDKETYPRIHTDFVTSARYHNAMKAGAKFPPIVVGLLNNQYYLIDGAHRLNARKSISETIEAEIVPVKDKKEIYLKAIDANIGHGRQFSTQEVTSIVLTLEKWNLSKIKIAEIVKIPVGHLNKFKATRTTKITGAGITPAQDIAIKSTLRHLAGTEQPVGFDSEQSLLVAGARSQERLLDTTITMLERNWFDLTDKVVVDKLEILQNLIVKVVPIK